MPAPERAGVVFQPQLHSAFLRGVQQIVAAVKPTIGPSRCHVAIDRPYRKAPEMLDNGGLIARRITDLGDRTEDAGAMLLRGMLWKIHDQMGDGTATATLLFDTLYRQGLKYLAAGGDATFLRESLEAAIPVIETGIAAQVRSITSSTMLTRFAEQQCDDPELAAAIAGVLDIAGPTGSIKVQKGYTRNIRKEFVEGSIWLGEELLPRTGTHPAGTPVHLTRATILVTDLPVASAADVRALHDVSPADQPLVVFIERLDDRGRGLLAGIDPARRPYLVRMPGGPGTPERMAFLTDVQALTGATPVLSIAGQSLARITPAVLGSARRVWLHGDAIGVTGGRGDPHRIRTILASCQQSLDDEPTSSGAAILRERMARLRGGSATLHVGGRSQPEITRRMELAEQVISTTRAALQGGFVPGGGVALLQCRDSFSHDLNGNESVDHRAVQRIIIAALESPARAILENNGIEAAPALATITDTLLIDARSGTMVDAWESGILDSAAVLRYAVRCALSSAAQALTIGALVQHRKPAIATVEG